MIVALFPSGDQSAGQTSPCSSVCGVEGVAGQQANFAVPKKQRTAHELEGLDQPERLVDRTSDREIIDGDLTKDTAGVDQEKSTEGDASILEQNTVVTSDLHRLVGYELELEIRAESAILALSISPGEMRELRVARDLWC